MYSFTDLGTYGFLTTPINTLQYLQILAPKRVSIFTASLLKGSIIDLDSVQLLLV